MTQAEFTLLDARDFLGEDGLGALLQLGEIQLRRDYGQGLG